MPFFRHTTKTRGVKADQPFGVHFFWKHWKAACTNLGIEGVDLYGGTRHSTTTWRAVEFGREKTKESSGHGTNKACDRYCQVDDFSFDIVTATAKKQGKIVELEAIKKKAQGGATEVPPKVAIHKNEKPRKSGLYDRKMERETGFEPATSTLARSHSTTELFPLIKNAIPKRFSLLCQLKFSPSSALKKTT